MNRDEISQLAAKVTDGTATDEELALYNQVCAGFYASEAVAPGEERAGERLSRQLRGHIKPVRTLKMNWMRWAAAAVVLAAIAGTWYGFLRKDATERTAPVVEIPVVHDANPAGDIATLTLADGSIVALDSALSSGVATVGNLRITNNNGVLSYQYDAALLPAAPLKEIPENTITTPRGGKYQLLLPDGTNVWLNAASSIRFPVFFADNKDRKVAIEGEAYFEVAKAGTPFKVQTKDYEIEVLGTHFNIDMYEDEPVNATTLLEGSVKVNFKKGTFLMKPGQQTRTWDQKSLTVVSDVNTEEVMAWKNGRFFFNDTDFKSIMRELARWYNVEVAYEGNISDKKYTVDLSRSTKLSDLLEILKVNGIQADFNGHLLTVKNQ